MAVTIHTGDCRDVLRTLPEQSVQCVVTSPPYFGLRDYGVDGQIGLEPTPDEFVAAMVEVFREVRRVLKDDGTLWLNLGDSYNAHSGQRKETDKAGPKQQTNRGASGAPSRSVPDLKPKDLIGIPWRVAFALQADGWYLRQDIIWCLSGGAWAYARTTKGDMPMMVRDLARLKPGTVQLWNGQKWTALLGMSKSARRGDEIEIVLASGERISCTPTHRFPTQRGLIEAGELKPGDTLGTCTLPQPETVRDCSVDEDAAWFAGLYLAEGSRSGDCIQIAGHSKEEARWANVQRIAAKFGGSATRTVSGNNCSIRVFGRVLIAIIEELVGGLTARDKCFAPVVWRYSNAFLSSMLLGYLSGDGHWDAKNKRWRLGFTRNYNLERDLRVVCARLGHHLVLKPSTSKFQNGERPSFRGEIRMERSGHFNQRNPARIAEIRKSRCREVYDLGVADEPHLFALASGVLTHNSKPNPMPESVQDRCTKAHEYIFLMSKSERYYYDSKAIAEPAATDDMRRPYGSPGANALDPRGRQGAGELRTPASHKGSDFHRGKTAEHQLGRASTKPRTAGNKSHKLVTEYEGSDSEQHRTAAGLMKIADVAFETRNKRSVWTVATAPFKEAHFATFPPDLVEPCIKAGCPAGGTVLDPFGGAGTTGLVADRLGRNAILIELNPEYAAMAERRIKGDAPLLAEVVA